MIQYKEQNRPAAWKQRSEDNTCTGQWRWSFFAAVLKSLSSVKDVNDLREEVCNHITENSEHYIPYIIREAKTASRWVQDHNTLDEYIDMLKRPGVWNTDIADYLPLAISNIYKTRVRIYSSNITASVLNFEPDISNRKTDNLLYLAYSCITGMEHYDAVGPYTYMSKEQSLNKRKIPDREHSPNRENKQRTSAKQWHGARTRFEWQWYGNSTQTSTIRRSPKKKILK